MPYALAKEKIFARSWQFIGDENKYGQNGYLYPLNFMEGCLDEPLLLNKNENGTLSLMSNVCTHRGYMLIEEPQKAQIMKCRYHGRCFHPDGKFLCNVSNDEENLYFRLKVADDLTQQKIGLFGLYLKLNPKGKRKGKLGLKYPIGKDESELKKEKPEAVARIRKVVAKDAVP